MMETGLDIGQLSLTVGDWVHSIDPVLLPISGRIAIRWYGLSYALGFFLAWVLMRWLAKRNACAVPVSRCADAILLTALCIVVGGRLGYVLIYQRSLLTDFHGGFPFWSVLDLTKGGMASHGGMIGAAIGAWFVSRGWKVVDESTDTITRVGRCSMRHMMDVFALLTPVGLLLGRLANFVNGELLGKIVAGPGQPAPWWAVRFPQEFSERSDELSDVQQEGLSLLAAQFYEQGDEFAHEGYNRAVALLREGSPEMTQQFASLLNARHPSQLYQALAEGVIVGLIVWWIARKPRTSGLISVWFLMSYGLLRIVTEFWRLPDAHLQAPRLLGLSRGQWLSAMMILIGAALCMLWRRDQSRKTGGWLTPQSEHSPETHSDSGSDRAITQP